MSRVIFGRCRKSVSSSSVYSEDETVYPHSQLASTMAMGANIVAKTTIMRESRVMLHCEMG